MVLESLHLAVLNVVARDGGLRGGVVEGAEFVVDIVNSEVFVITIHASFSVVERAHASEVHFPHLLVPLPGQVAPPSSLDPDDEPQDSRVDVCVVAKALSL